MIYDDSTIEYGPNVRTDRLPATIWIALERDDDALVVHVGVAGVIWRVCDALIANGIQPPACCIDAISQNGVATALGVMILGAWPSYEEARAIASEIATPREFPHGVETILQIAKRCPTAIWPYDARVSEEVVTNLADAYIQHVRRLALS